jgi:hypothetical protein
MFRRNKSKGITEINIKMMEYQTGVKKEYLSKQLWEKHFYNYKHKKKL